MPVFLLPIVGCPSLFAGRDLSNRSNSRGGQPFIVGGDVTVEEARQLDALVARALGWELVIERDMLSIGTDHEMVQVYRRPSRDGTYEYGYMGAPCLPYSGSDSIAFMALDEIGNLYPSWFLGVHRHINAGSWDAEVGTGWANAPTRAEAICRAILAAWEVK